MIIDVHNHYVPPGFVSGDPGDGRLLIDDPKRGLQFSVRRKHIDLDGRIKDMDAAGVDVHLLSSPAGWNAPPATCRMANDALAEDANKYPERLLGLAHLPHPSTGETLEELDHAVNDLGFRGISLTSQMSGDGLHLPPFFPLYERASRKGLPIFVHPALKPAGYASVDEFRLGKIVGREFDLLMTVCRLVFGGVLERFPELKVVVAHFGGGIGSTLNRIEDYYQNECKGTPAGDCTLRRDFREYLDKLYFDTSGVSGWINGIRTALGAMRVERLVFGSDYPSEISSEATPTRSSLRGYVNAIRSLEIPEADRKAILGGNIGKLLGLP